MNSLFWNGKLSIPVKIMVNANSIISWLLGKTRNAPAMKHRMRLGYSGACSDHVRLYDEVGNNHYSQVAQLLLNGLDLSGKTVLDVGCGTGIVSFKLLEKGVEKVIGVDLSQKMINRCIKKASERRYEAKAEFKLSDAENMQFGDNSFDTVISSLIFGLVPNQLGTIKEMVRVLKPGGLLGLSTHGPEHYWQGCNATFKMISKLPIIGYRVEYWPLTEKRTKKLLEQAGLKDIKTKRLKWEEKFNSPEKAYDFFAVTSSAWWLSKFPAKMRIRESRKIRAYFKLKKIDSITMEVVFAYGMKNG